MSPILHMCHMLGTEMIHFVHQMQYYITFEVRTRGLRRGGGARYWYPGVPNTSHVSGTEMIHFFYQMQFYITFEVRARGPERCTLYGVPFSGLGISKDREVAS